MVKHEDKEGGFDLPSFLKHLPHHPGIYCMVDAKGTVIYVGKAKDLKKRVSSYFRKQILDPKTLHLVQHIHHIEITLTRNEREALLLENNLIKQHQPRYNIVLRDDKSYPYLFISAHPFPRIAFHRGAKTEKGYYFGPYVDSRSVRETLTLLEKIFRIRNCEDSFFEHRSRPCIQYQIARCTAPCVAYVEEIAYREQVQQALMFLQGKSQTLLDEYAQKMEAAAAALDFEKASGLRDQIRRLQRIQERQLVFRHEGKTDIFGFSFEQDALCIYLMVIREGQMLGGRAFHFSSSAFLTLEEAFEAFLAQYYLNDSASHDIPNECLLAYPLESRSVLEESIQEKAGHAFKIVTHPRGDRAVLARLATTNAVTARNAKQSSKTQMVKRFQALQEALHFKTALARLECFDVSHTQGEATVASCVVFDTEGPLKRDYRRYNIENITKGDDYAAMRQVLQRRYERRRDEKSVLPDLILVDGGKGQLNVALEVLAGLNLSDIPVLGVAKGPSRKPGQETLILSTAQHEFHLETDSIALHLIQQIRDEAHRFAITLHRKKRAKATVQSGLEKISGVGPNKRRALLQFFGGAPEVMRASVEELMKIPGISQELAQRIYDSFRK